MYTGTFYRIETKNSSYTCDNQKSFKSITFAFLRFNNSDGISQTTFARLITARSLLATTSKARSLKSTPPTAHESPRKLNFLSPRLTVPASSPLRLTCLSKSTTTSFGLTLLSTLKSSTNARSVAREGLYLPKRARRSRM